MACGPNCKCDHCTGKADSCPAPSKTESKPKPCCVCLDQKSLRDECILLWGQDSPKCADTIAQYKECMKGFGFSI